MKKVLITGAGTGFGHEVAMRLARKGFDVIAAVEIYAQVQTLKREAAARGVTLRVEKLDVTNEGDRKKALAWNIDACTDGNRLGPVGGRIVTDVLVGLIDADATSFRRNDHAWQPHKTLRELLAS